MSEPTSTESSPLSSIIIRIITNHIRAIEALATASMNSLNYAMLLSSYKNVISLAHALHSSRNLTDQFATLATENEDLMLKQDTTIADYNTLTACVSQLKVQLTQMLALANAATLLPVSCRSQLDPKLFTREDYTLLQPFLLTLHLYLQDYPREFPNE
jgi:hypothetical protein